jgi:CRP-like cAMP-binding protein
MELIHTSGKSCLSTLTQDESKELFESNNNLEFGIGELVVKKGTPVNNLYFLRSGIIELSLDQESKNQSLTILFPGDFIGINCVYSASTYRFSAKALTSCTIEIFSRDLFSNFLQGNNKFAMSFIQYISLVNESFLNWHMNLNEKNSAGALAFLLAEFEKKSLQPTFEIPITRKDIARIIGFSKESVLKNLADFRKEGIIESNGKLITILDSHRLHEIVKHG